MSCPTVSPSLDFSTCPDYEPDCTHHSSSIGWYEDKGEFWDMEQECMKPQTPCDALSVPGMVGCHSDKSKICTRDEWYCAASDAVVASDPKPVSLARPISSHLRNRTPIDASLPTETVVVLVATDKQDYETNNPLYPMFVLVFVCMLVYMLFVAFV